MIGICLWQFELNKAAKLNKDEDVLSLLFDKDAQNDPNYYTMLNTAFSIACAHGSLDVIRKINSSEMFQKKVNVNTVFEVDHYLGIFTTPLIKACEGNHFELVKYIMTNSSITKPDLSMFNYDSIMLSVQNKSNDVLFYLFKREELSNKLKDNEFLNKIFKISLYNSNIKVLEHLVFNLNIDYTSDIVNLLKSAYFANCINEVHNMFISRELRNNLTKE